eukprot:GHVO01010500.1.p1 GENE.GHVO01010500.1~~GHVO01010500.1.p1  ORF type:complete len:300 (+),score=38.69 GHVO01010500.1:883-1782(+)
MCHLCPHAPFRFICLKQLGPLWVNRVMNTVVLFSGTVAVTETFYALLHTWRPFKSLIPKRHRYVFGFPLNLMESEINTDRLRICIYMISVGTVVASAATKCDGLSNIIAICLGIYAISGICVGSFYNAGILLVLLFIYDIFMVFGTAKLLGGKSIMESVAMSISGPIKIVLNTIRDGEPNKSILGLGDVILPGLVSGLALRFDYSINKGATGASKEDEGLPVYFKPSGKFGFWAVMVMYQVGLMVTGIAVAKYKVAQPALLYLVPASLCGLFVGGLRKATLKDMWNYKDGSDCHMGKNE